MHTVLHMMNALDMMAGVQACRRSDTHYIACYQWSALILAAVSTNLHVCS